MNFEKRSNPFGGSAGGGGYDYQAEVYALVAAKILAQEGLNWPDTGCDRIPVSIRMETGSGGDDVRITLRSGIVVELQAKRGLQRGDDLWHALMGLARVVNAAPNTYGVLFTTTDASNPIRVNLRNGIVRLGQGIRDDLPDIVEDFFKRLQDTGITDISLICSRIRIVIRDLDPGSSGEEETLAVLRKVVAEAQSVNAARNTLVSDGLDLIKLRGGRDASSLVKVIKQAGILLSTSATNLTVRREAFIEWSIKINETISIPSLNLKLPMSKAWIRLRAMDPEKATSGSKLLTEQIRNYHEWQRLANTNYTSDAFNVELVARSNRLLVIVGGPGSGKSTLLRRLTQIWSEEGLVILRVSLRAMALRMRKGATFEEALLSATSEGFSVVDEPLRHVLLNSSCILADGLDEIDSDREGIADRLRRWAVADTNRRVVVTTRPVGHNPAWFGEWKHFELLPLGQSDIEEFARTIFGLLHSNDSKQAAQTSNAFLVELKHSRTASIAARNPQLLGFLIALYINGYGVGGNRFRLYSNVIEEIRKRTDRDRSFQYKMDAPTVGRVLNCLGWMLLTSPILSEDDFVQKLGQQLAADLSLSNLQSQQIASEALSFWEERGLLERLNNGAITTFTFVHMAFQEFAAARFLAGLPQERFAEWISSNYAQSEFREVLLLTGATSRLPVAIRTLLEIDDPADPVSTAALLAADVLAESEDPSNDLRESVFEHLLPRLTSNVPMVVYETGEKLRLLALSNPALIGPMVIKLAKHEQRWTREVACALGLLSGMDYVDEGALLTVFPDAKDSQVRSGSSGMSFHHSPLIEDLLTRGANYLLRDSASTSYLDIVKKKYKKGDCSSRVHRFLEDLLRPRITSEEFRSLGWWDRMRGNVESFQKSFQAQHEGDQALLEAIRSASQRLIDLEEGISADPHLDSLARLWDVFKISESPASDMPSLRYQHLMEPLIEVIRGAILTASLKPAQVMADTEEALHQLGQPPTHFYELIKNSNDFQAGFKPNWSLARGQGLAPALLIQAIGHPSGFICRFATMLLWECFERDVVRSGFRAVLTSGSQYALEIVAQIASELWQEEAADLILDRLEQRLTSDCTPLIRALGETCGEPSKLRAATLLRSILAVKDAEMVEAALYAIEKIGLDESMAATIKSSYRWWLVEGPQDPVEGVVPKNAAAALFSHLNAKQWISFEEACEAANAKRSDVCGVAVKAICQILAANEELIEPTFDEIRRGKLSRSVVNELSRSYPSICQQHLDNFLRLLNSEDRLVQIACIAALGDGWVEYSQIEAKLRSLLYAADANIRDEALRTLRRLNVRLSA